MNSISFYLFAKQAAGDYIGANKDLNDSIAKIAGDNGLSQVQIQRIVELANHEVNDHLRKLASEKTFTFNVASVDGVLSKMQGIPKVAGITHSRVVDAIHAYNRGIGEESIDARVQEIMDGSNKKELLEKQASLHQKLILEKLAAVRRRTESEKIGSLNKVAEELREFVQTAKQFVYGEQGTLDDLKKYAEAVVPNWSGWDVVFEVVQAELRKVAGKYNAKNAAKLKLCHVAPLAARSNTEGETPKVRVVNGAHKLGYQVKKVHERVTDAQILSSRLTELDNFKDVLTKNVTNFNTSADVEKYLGTLYKVDKAVSSDQFSNDLLKKLGEDEVKKLTAEETRKAALGLLFGEAATRASKATLGSAAKHLIHNKTPAAHQGPIKNLPQYETGQ
jgi:hypothetical protein